MIRELKGKNQNPVFRQKSFAACLQTSGLIARGFQLNRGKRLLAVFTHDFLGKNAFRLQEKTADFLKEIQGETSSFFNWRQGVLGHG